MGMIEWCNVCGRLIFRPERTPHKCPPKFEVTYDEYDPEHTWIVFAGDHEQAAEKWAEEYDGDDCDYTVAQGKENPVIRVREQREKTWRTFSVTGELVASYSAKEVQEEI